MSALVLALALAVTTAASPSVLAGSGRDPFQGPSEVRDEPCDPPGLHCVSWQRVKLTGVVTSPGGAVVTLQAAGGETFLAREGDRLRNAILWSVDPERTGVILREPAPDLVPGYREVILRVGAEAPVVREPVAADPALPAGR